MKFKLRAKLPSRQRLSGDISNRPSINVIASADFVARCLIYNKYFFLCVLFLRLLFFILPMFMLPFSVSLFSFPCRIIWTIYVAFLVYLSSYEWNNRIIIDVIHQIHRQYDEDEAINMKDEEYNNNNNNNTTTKKSL